MARSRRIGSMVVAYSTTDRQILLRGRDGVPHPIAGASLAPGEYITVFSPDMKYLQTQTSTEIPAQDLSNGSEDGRQDSLEGDPARRPRRCDLDRRGPLQQGSDGLRVRLQPDRVFRSLRRRGTELTPMIPSLRRAYNAAYTDEKYRGLPAPPRRARRHGDSRFASRSRRSFCRRSCGTRWSRRRSRSSASFRRRRRSSARRPRCPSASTCPSAMRPTFAVDGLCRHERRRRAARSEVDRAPGFSDALRLPGRAM